VQLTPDLNTKPRNICSPSKSSYHGDEDHSIVIESQSEDSDNKTKHKEAKASISGKVAVNSNYNKVPNNHRNAGKICDPEMLSQLDKLKKRDAKKIKKIKEEYINNNVKQFDEHKMIKFKKDKKKSLMKDLKNNKVSNQRKRKRTEDKLIDIHKINKPIDKRITRSQATKKQEEAKCKSNNNKEIDKDMQNDMLINDGSSVFNVDRPIPKSDVKNSKPLRKLTDKSIPGVKDDNINMESDDDSKSLSQSAKS